jgi:hypothetical protein
MSFRLSSLRICFGVMAVAGSSLPLCSAHAGGEPRGRSIEFSEARSDEGTTNLHQLTGKKDGLKQLEEDLYRPLQMLAPQSSLEGVIAAPSRPAAGPLIQNKRVKELLERRKNWVFMSPEDMMAGPTVDDILKSPHYDAKGQEKKELRPLEQYYQRLTTKRPGGINPGQSTGDDLFGPPKNANPRDQLAAHDDSSLPSGLRESAMALKHIVEPETSGDPFARSAAHSSFSDVFGLGDRTLSKEQLLARDKLLDEQRSLVDPGWQRPAAASPLNPLPAFTDAARPSGTPAAGLGGLPGVAAHRGLEAQMDITHPLLGPAGLPDVNAQALGLPRSAPGSPTVAPPRMVAPTFTAPKRSF